MSNLIFLCVISGYHLNMCLFINTLKCAAVSECIRDDLHCISGFKYSTYILPTNLKNQWLDTDRTADESHSKIDLVIQLGIALQIL